MVGSQGRESRFPFRTGGKAQPPLPFAAVSLQSGKARHGALTSSQHGYCYRRKVTITTEVGFNSHPQAPRRKRQPHLPSKWEKSKNQKNEAISRHLPCSGWDVKATSNLGTHDRDLSSPLRRAGRLVPSITPRNTYQETVKHTRRYYWETCRQIINLLGTIKAFRCFWLQMPGTHTLTYKPHSSLHLSDSLPAPPPLYLNMSLSRNKLSLLS